MNNLILLLKSFRLLNVFSMLLLLVGLRFYFWKHFVKLGFYSFERSNGDFLLLLLTVGFISASGYLVNDILDVKVDKVNKPEKKLAFSKPVLWSVYFIIIALSLFLILCIENDYRVKYILLISVFLLFFYSFLFQKLPLVGNLIVAILSGVLLVLYNIFEHLKIDGSSFNLNFLTSNLISFYIVLGFGITFLRELIKDIEDIEGDKAASYKTFPVLVGIKGSKVLFYFLVTLFMVSILFFDYNLFNHFLFNNYLYYLSTFIFLLISLFQVYQSNFSKASLFLKLTLFSGVLVLFIL